MSDHEGDQEVGGDVPEKDQEGGCDVPEQQGEVPIEDPADLIRLVQHLTLQVQEQQRTMTAMKSSTTVVLPGPSRKLSRFSDKPTKSTDVLLEDWILELQTASDTRKLSGAEFAQLIIDHLEGRARREILARGETVKGSPESIFKILRRVFGTGEDLATAQRRFYSAKQANNQDLVTFSLDLIDLYEKIVMIDASFSANRETALKGQLAEGAVSDTYRREIRRLIREKSDLSFLDLRDTLVSWAGSVSTASEKVSVQEHSTNIPLQDIIMKQQKQIDDLIAQVNRPRKTTSKCWDCGVEGHFRRNCPTPKANPKDGQSVKLND